ncbi:hypothetical protein H4R24_004462 [Coemansia sp. RSA 988]|nr:hypothetical protein H4R24_004462 [Coemansia sp. RSA 988]
MEAVVMARPAIRCFSTDLPPLGCDVIYQPVAPTIADMIMNSGCNTCSSLTHHARRFDLAPSGPCDCHVQDIACLGCGNVVGYYIHRPCFRCLAQRLRIKQRGFQHLWTFYHENVTAIPRENDLGEPVGWEELPIPPPPTSSAMRSSSSQTNVNAQNTVVRESDVIESNTRSRSNSTGNSTARYTRPLNDAFSRDDSTTQPVISPSAERRLAIGNTRDSIQRTPNQQRSSSTSRRTNAIVYMSQRPNRDVRQESIRESIPLRESQISTTAASSVAENTHVFEPNTSNVTVETHDNPTPIRTTTQTVLNGVQQTTSHFTCDTKDTF